MDSRDRGGNVFIGYRSWSIALDKCRMQMQRQIPNAPVFLSKPKNVQVYISTKEIATLLLFSSASTKTCFLSVEY